MLEPLVREDSRGYFFRTFDRNELIASGIEIGELVQINQSFSKAKNTFRGFHYQTPPFAEEKIVTCLEGEIIDFIVDIRKGSKTFLKVESIGLSETNFKSVLVPKGCAHGFITLRENTRLLYFHTAPYSPSYEAGVSVYDPRLDIKMPDIHEISERDKNHPLLSDQFIGIEL